MSFRYFSNTKLPIYRAPVTHPITRPYGDFYPDYSLSIPQSIKTPVSDIKFGFFAQFPTSRVRTLEHMRASRYLTANQSGAFPCVPSKSTGSANHPA
jgi:hypothetical protein